MTAIFALIFSLVIFGEQLMYCLTISSYLYVLVFLTILRTVFFTKSNDLLILILCLFLVICKSSIFYSALVMYMYLLYRNKHYFFNSINIIVLILVLFNILSWALIVSPYQNEDLSFRLFNPLNIEYSLKFAVQIRGWIMGDPFIDWLNKNYVSSIVIPLIVIFVLTKFYLPAYLSNNICRQIIQKNRELYFMHSIEIYLIVSLLGWVLIRNGYNFSHQAHGFLLALVPSLFFLSHWIISLKKPTLLILFYLFFL